MNFSTGGGVPDARKKAPGSRYQFHVVYFLAAAAIIVAIQTYWAGRHAIEVIPYSQFQTLLKQGRIEDIEISKNQIYGQFKPPLPNKKPYFVTARVEPDLAEELEQYHVKFSRQLHGDLIAGVLSWIIPAVIFFGFWIWLTRRAPGTGGFGGSLMSIGKSKARVYVETNTRTTFQDVAGVDEAVDELKEIVDFLKNPRAYGRLGGRMPKGVLLVGPPGSGKTLLAKAVAGEAGVPFYSINGSEFVEMFVGVGAARVRDLFEQAHKTAPCIIFIDELDALGRARGSFPSLGGHDEKEQTLNQLLVELDGFDSRAGLILLAATNRPEILDPALLRAGRFDRQVLVDRPDKRGRVDVLNIYLRKVTLDADADPEKIAALTPGFTGADLANLVNEAALVATRRKAERVSMLDFNAAIERIVAGLEKKNRLLNPKEREIVAHHEMGHALVAASLPGADPIHKVSIIPRGIAALGYTMQRPIEDRFLMTRSELEDKMTVLLGGRAAERLIFGRLSTGAHDDLTKATEIARHMATRYGMVSALGQVTYEREPSVFLGTVGPRAREYSEATADKIDAAIRDIIEDVFRRATDILTRNRKVLLYGAAVLLSKETLSEEELRPIFAKISPPGGAHETPD